MAPTCSKYSQPWRARHTKESPVVPSPPPPLGQLMQTLRVEDLDEEAKSLEVVAQIHNTRTVNSFNWVDKKSSGPTILIPGKPPLWTPQTNPSRLKEDSGSYFRDKNAARYPQHPIEPAVVAALAGDSTVPSEVDIFACGSTLGNLLRFVRGEDKAFRMLAYKLRNTVFLVRRENSPTELIPDVRGYGHTFPGANTTWEPDVKGSASHQRLVRYDFGELDLVVRFEADGYIKPTGQSAPSLSTSSLSTLAELTSSLSDTTITPDLLAQINSTSASIATTTTPTTTTNNTPSLTIQKAGTLTPSTTLFDLKTRSIRTRFRKDHLAEELPRLWISQIPNFILAFHTSGLFNTEDVEIKDVRDDVTAWEEEYRNELGRLAALLHWLRREVVTRMVGKEEGDGEVIEICHCVEGGDVKGVLEVRRAGGEVAGSVVGKEVRERWMDAGRREKGGEEPEGNGEVGGGRVDGEKESIEKERLEGKGDEEYAGEGSGGVEWEEGDEDFTACGQDCGYCGRCTY